MNTGKKNAGININSFTDIHCHILPNIDDGAKNIDTSIKMASIAVSEGIDRIIATPHFDPGTDNIEVFLEKRNNALAALKSELEARNIDIDIIPGAEVYLSPALINMEGLEQLCLGDSRYLLAEMPFTLVPQWLDEILYSIQLKGITPILAHPERSVKVIKEPHILDKIVRNGTMLQLNASSICHMKNRQLRKCIKYLFGSGMVHFIATDAHSTLNRKPVIQPALDIISEMHGRDMVEYLLENARVLGNGGIVEKRPCVEYRPGLWERLFG